MRKRVERAKTCRTRESNFLPSDYLLRQSVEKCGVLQVKAGGLINRALQKYTLASKTELYLCSRGNKKGILQCFSYFDDYMYVE